MTRALLAACALFTVASCGPRNNDGIPSQRNEARHTPTTTTPGVRVSGYASVGVVGRF